MNVAAFERFHFLNAVADDFRAGGLREFGEFGERFADVPRGRAI